MIILTVTCSFGILCREQENIIPHTLAFHHNTTSVDITLEGNVIMDVENLPQAMCNIFGLTYALHLNYPKSMKNTFDFIQQVLLNLDKTEESFMQAYLREFH